MDLTVLTYVIYLAVSVTLTIWVARTLTRNGDVFLVDVFRGEEKIAAATNRLLVAGFYLVNLGFVALMLRVSWPVETVQGAIEALASKLGAVSLLLGIFHLVNVFVLSQVRRHRAVPRRPQAPGAPGPYPGQAGPHAGQPGPYAPQPGPYAPQTGQYAGQPGPYGGQPGPHAGQWAPPADGGPATPQA